MTKTNGKPGFIIAAALMLLPAAAQAEVSLDSCRNMALRNNKTIQVAEENIRGAGYSRQAARAAYLPGIDFAGGYTYNQHKIELLGADAKLPTMTFNPLTQSYDYNLLIGPDLKPVVDPATGTPIPLEVAVIPKEAMEFDTHNVFAGAITLTQPIFMGGQIRALNKLADDAEALSRNARSAVVQEVIYNVDQAYWMVVSLKEKQKLAESFVDLMGNFRDNVDAMLQEGVATRSDKLQVEVAYNEACIARTKVDNGLTLAHMALAQVCGLPVDTRMELSDRGLSRNLSTTAPDITLDMQSVFERRPDLASVRNTVSMMQHKEDLALGQLLPKVALVGAYAFSNPNVNHGFEKKFGGGFSVGATLTIPIWHWGGNYNQLRAARSNTAAQRLLLEDLEEKVTLQANQARFSYQEAFKTYEMTLSNEKSAQANLDNARIGFQEGVLTTDDVIAAQTAWLKANSEHIDAEIGIRLCETYLAKVLGTLGSEPQ